MKTNELYRAQLEAARRAARWIDDHPAANYIFFATAAAFFFLYVLFFYPL